MQAVGPVIHCQSIGCAIEREMSARDAIRIAADDRAEVRRIGYVAGEIVVAEHDVGDMSVTVGSFERRDDPAVIGELHFDTMRIAQCEELSALPIGECSKRRRLTRRHALCSRSRSDCATTENKRGNGKWC